MPHFPQSPLLRGIIQQETIFLLSPIVRQALLEAQLALKHNHPRCWRVPENKAAQWEGHSCPHSPHSHGNKALSERDESPVGCEPQTRGWSWDINEPGAARREDY